MKQRRKKRTQPPPKENLLENFSGLKEKLSIPVVDTKTLQKPGKPYPPPKSFLCGPHFFLQRKVLHWSRAVYGFFSPDERFSFARAFSERFSKNWGVPTHQVCCLLPKPQGKEGQGCVLEISSLFLFHGRFAACERVKGNKQTPAKTDRRGRKQDRPGQNASFCQSGQDGVDLSFFRIILGFLRPPNLTFWRVEGG